MREELVEDSSDTERNRVLMKSTIWTAFDSLVVKVDYR